MKNEQNWSDGYAGSLRDLQEAQRLASEWTQSNANLVAPPMDPRILVVDDDPGVRGLLRTIISGQGFTCDTASSLESARQIMARRRYDVLFVDLNLPDGQGLRILEDGLDVRENTMVTIVSGNGDLETAVRAMREGAYDFIEKPFAVETFIERLSQVTEEWRSRKRFEYYQRHLERLVTKMTEQLETSSQEIERTRDMAVAALGAAIDLRDPETEGHCRRVAERSVVVGKAFGMTTGQLQDLRRGAYLHDIGKIAVPESVLSKRGSLSSKEMELVRLHPVLGFRLISKIDFLRTASEVVLYHHERYDGTGYPHGLRGKQIPLAPRIFSVVDTIDAMLNDRSYRKAVAYSTVVKELERQAGTQFDPEVVSKVLAFPVSLWEKGDSTALDEQILRHVSGEPW